MQFINSDFQSFLESVSRVTGWVWLGLVLFFCASCAAPSVGIDGQQKVLAGADESYQDQKAKANDMACAYFYFLWGKTAENNHRFDEALEAYEMDLKGHPNRFNGIYGAAVASKASGDNEKAKSYFEDLLKLVGLTDSERPEVGEAKVFLRQI